MYICPTCGSEFKTEKEMQKHYLACWKENHSFHQSKAAPHSEDIVKRTVNRDIANFFEGLNYGRSTN